MPNTRILVVNDDKGVLLVTSHILRNAGYEILTASSGQACLDLMRPNKKPELVLLDVVMPGIDGFEVCRRIKSDQDLPGIIVILYSSKRAGLDDQVQGLAAGADGYIVYPCPPDVLLARIEAFARIHKSEQRLRESEERYRDFFENAIMGIFRALPEGRFLTVNPAMAKILLYDSPEEMVSSITDIADQLFVDPQRRSAGLPAAMKGEWVEAENRFLRKDGTIMTAHHTFRAILNQTGSIDYLEGFVEDITRRKEAEEEQQTTIELLYLINASDSTGKMIRDISEFLQKRFDCEAVGIRLPKGEDFPYFVATGFPDGFAASESMLCTRDKEGKNCYGADGKPLLDCLCGAVIRDCTDSSKPFFTEHGSFWTGSFTELLMEPDTVADIEHVRGKCPASGYESMALVPLQLGAKKIGLLQLCDRRQNVFDPRVISFVERTADKIAIALARLTAEEALQEAHFALEQRVEERTGELVKTNDRLNREIEERKRAEAQLYRSKVMLQMVFDGIPDPLVMIDRERKVRMINKGARDYYHLTRYSEAIGRTCFEGLRGRSGPCSECERPISDLFGYTGSYERNSPIDRNRLERVSVYQTIGELTGEEVRIIRISDITHAKMMEKQLIQNEKLASLGLLISGIAHEINNPNSFISFNIPILRDYLNVLMPLIDEHAGKDAEFKPFGMSYDEFRTDIFKLVENMEHGSARINSTISGLKEFVRKRERVELCQVDLKRVVDKAVALCRPEMKKYIKSFSVSVPEAMPPLLTDPEALEQVIINLLINASHAAEKEDSWVKLEIIPGGEHPHCCIIEVSDNGNGMDEATKRKIFDPFFTTKGSRKGTGLGLYICHNLMEGLGGKIEVESEPGKGSTFRIVLYDQAELKN
jgi:PAS domain S-box-containing protein